MILNVSDVFNTILKKYGIHIVSFRTNNLKAILGNTKDKIEKRGNIVYFYKKIIMNLITAM